MKLKSGYYYHLKSRHDSSTNWVIRVEDESGYDYVCTRVEHLNNGDQTHYRFYIPKHLAYNYYTWELDSTRTILYGDSPLSS